MSIYLNKLTSMLRSMFSMRNRMVRYIERLDDKSRQSNQEKIASYAAIAIIILLLAAAVILGFMVWKFAG